MRGGVSERFKENGGKSHECKREMAEIGRVKRVTIIPSP